MRPGILLVALVAASLPRAGQPAWHDPSPHTQRLVTVADGVRVELLDWGGAGRTLVLLAQNGQTAHIYDEWAPTLTKRFRVLAITRRGFGASSVPPDGYSTEALARDVLAVLQAEHLSRSVLIGNGVAGEELSWIGAHAPGRVAGLVYLDAAYDRSRVAEEAALARRIPPPEPPRADVFASVEAFTRWASRRVRIPEAEIRQLATVGDDGRIAGERTPAFVRQQIVAGIQPTDYSQIRVPTLAIFANHATPNGFPGCQTTDTDVRAACQELYAWTQRQLTNSIRGVRRIQAPVRVLRLRDADQFAFLSNQAEVTRAIDRFVSKLRD